MFSIPLKVKILDIDASYPIAILRKEIAKELSAHQLDRVEIRKKDFRISCILDTSDSYVDADTIGIFADFAKQYNLKEGMVVNVNLMSHPSSVDYIIRKIKNKELSEEQINEIVNDIAYNKLSNAELSAFVTAVYINRLNLEETENLCRSLVNAGDRINFDRKEILDKHSIGGINGRVSMILVPIISSLGYFIPKTSSRAISSCAGTADSMEVLAPVDLNIEKIKNVISKTNGVIVWEGKFDLCPTDNKIIKIEHALGINPEGIMIASVLSKKISAGATHLVLDIPVGSNTKVKTKEDGERLAKKFISISNVFNLKTKVILTDAESPCGNAFGPALEAKEVLEILEGKYFNNLAKKSCELAGELLELVGRVKEGEGYKLSKDIISSGKALSKFKEIIIAQGGGDILESSQIKEAKYKLTLLSNKNGVIDRINTQRLTEIARFAGAPKDKQAGLTLFVNVGDNIKEGDPLFRIYSNSKDKLDYAFEFAKHNDSIRFKKIILEEIH